MSEGEHEPCKGCKFSLFYKRLDGEDWACSHSRSNQGVGHNRLGKEQPVYISQSLFYRADCKGALYE